MVATPRSGVNISKIVKAIKTTVTQKKTTEASQLPTPLCYAEIVGNVSNSSEKNICISELKLNPTH